MLQISCDEKELSLPGAILATCRRMEDTSAPIGADFAQGPHDPRDASRCLHFMAQLPQASHELLEASVGE